MSNIWTAASEGDLARVQVLVESGEFMEDSELPRQSTERDYRFITVNRGREYL